MRKKLPSSIYGPVKSWRLGKSLGVDVLCIDSICSFECVYCQLGKINLVTTERKVFVSTKKILTDLKKANWEEADVITFSGSGEPTLAQNLGAIIEGIKKITQKPIVVLTNSTLLIDKTVRKDLLLADKIFCKLDAWSPETLRRIDRPAKNISIDNIITGICLLRKEFSGFLGIQTMILRSPDTFEIKRFSEILMAINPDEVQLNLPTRPIPQTYFLETRGNEVEADNTFTRLKTVSKEELTKIKGKLSDLVTFPIVIR